MLNTNSCLKTCYVKWIKNSAKSVLQNLGIPGIESQAIAWKWNEVWSRVLCNQLCTSMFFWYVCSDLFHEKKHTVKLFQPH